LDQVFFQDTPGGSCTVHTGEIEMGHVRDKGGAKFGTDLLKGGEQLSHLAVGGIFNSLGDEHPVGKLIVTDTHLDAQRDKG